MTKEFNYQEWRAAYLLESGAPADAVDYYCTILARAPDQGAEHANLEKFMTSKSIRYVAGEREFKHVEALWSHVRAKVIPPAVTSAKSDTSKEGGGTQGFGKGKS